jgi:hypothetical protein
MLTALYTALAFTLLLLTAASHHHEGQLESRACAACGVIVDQLARLSPGGGTLLPLPPVVLSYHLDGGTSSRILRPAPRLLPPSCGPPYPA